MSTRDDLLLIAEMLFAEKGFYGASIKDIADKLGITKQALLHHFKSKEKLYGEVLKLIADQLMATMDPRGFAEEEGGDKFQWMISRLHGYLNEHPYHASLISRELLDNENRAQDAVTWHMAPFLQQLKDVVEQGQRQGSYQKLDAMVFIVSILGAMQYFLASLPTLKQILSAAEYKSAIKNQHQELMQLIQARLFLPDY